MDRNSSKPWPENPEWLKEMSVIKRALLFCVDCRACAALGWDRGCRDRRLCGAHLYAKMREHYARTERLKKTSPRDAFLIFSAEKEP